MRIDQWGGGGGGGGYCRTDQNNSSFRVYFVVQIPPFIDWTCSAEEECGATAEITRSLQIDLVLSDEAATSHFAYGDAAMRPKCVRYPKMQYLRKSLQLARSLSLLSILTKPLERRIHKHLTQSIEDRKLFHPFQSGLRQWHFCHTALIRVCDTWLAAINQTKFAGAVFLDFKKACDHVTLSIIRFFSRNV